MIFNIFNSLYLSSCLEITGPELLKKFIKDNLVLKKCNDIHDNWKNSFLINNDNNLIVIKNSYYNYYIENNYINTNHYGILYNQRKVFNEIEIPYHKINKIDLILWINLERSPHRKEHMENMTPFIQSTLGILKDFDLEGLSKLTSAFGMNRKAEVPKAADEEKK